GLRAPTPTAPLQLLPKRAAQPAHVPLKRGPRPYPLAPLVPPGKEHGAVLQQDLTHRLGRTAAVDHGLEFPPQVGPADLSALERVGIIDLSPITRDDAAIGCSHQLLQHRRPARRRNLEDADLWSHCCPQPAPPCALAPGRLIDIGVL